MKCVEVFPHREPAAERARLLKEQGLTAKVFVDPMESLYPALATFHGVALMVPDDEESEALRILGRGGLRRVG